ncbi:HTH domain-containing protein [Chondromyces crocatus]|uniref:HTH HARE-type domain-containing protein n=1 Tax=Chondromyces crocatus TaxID=52 RepID=A0A0K1EES5_CHOCO|nr:HTH domain-containing protein [Chondromyces crocatus]AKT39058.1 uncharacterized protein CMC5_032040 [Chondromyces crocatus]
MTFTDAAAEVLRLVGRPLHYKEITDIAIEKNLLSHVGKSPEVTMGARLAAMLKKDSPENPLVRVKPGVFALREWDERTIRAGLDKKGKRPAKAEEVVKPAPEVESDAEAELGVEAEADGEFEEPGEAEESVGLVEAEDGQPELPPSEDDSELLEASTEVEVSIDAAATDEEDEERPSSEHSAQHRAVVIPPASPSRSTLQFVEEEEDAEPAGPDDVMRAEAVAGAAEIFDEEDDDDQPILGGDDRSLSAADQGEGRRRRRRRRRGRSGPETGAPGNGGLPTYTATPVEGRSSEGRGAEGRSSEGRGAEGRSSEGRGFEGRSFEGRGFEGRNGGREPAVTTEPAFRPQIIEFTGGEGYALDDLGGRDLADAVASLLATFDRNAGPVSLRQIAETAQRRGKLQGDPQLVQSQVAAAMRADNARRTAAGQRARFRFTGGRVALTDWQLSGELVRLEQEALQAVERYRDAARRLFARKLAELPGHAFVELCLLALERVGMTQIRAVRRAGTSGAEAHFTGVLRPIGGEEMRVALVIRRDGREIGRERVTELRGGLHHYGPAVAGWLLTAGQTLSGAREEAGAAGAAPISLYDGASLARLCEENDVAVLRARLPIAIPDVDLLDALRAS